MYNIAYSYNVKKILFVQFLLGVCLSLTAQTRFPVIPIYLGSGSFFNEPSICVNPKNTNQIVAGSVINDYYYSGNGGLNWTHGTLSSPWGVWGDPSVVIDTSGSWYYFHLSYPSSPGWWIDRIICQKSTDAGHTWSSGSYMGLNTSPHRQDKPWAAVNRNNNHIYATWTEFDDYNVSIPTDSSRILFSKSTDGGLTWSSPKRICRKAGDCLDNDNTVEGAVPAVGPQGQIYVSWAGPLGIMFNRSLDEGTTWVDTNIFVSLIPSGWDYLISGIDRSNGLPVTCCDISNGPYRGNIYVNWSDQRNGPTDTDVWFKRSSDGGNTWSSLKRVNDDPPGKQQFFTWMCVDQVTGYIYIVFYDRRNYTDDNTDVYLAVSRDAGNTFENIRISDNPFLPNSGVFFGDYTNISAYNNIVRPIWTDLSGNSKTIKTVLIDSLYTSAITWTGGTSTDWNNSWNWMPRAIPTSIQDVVIPQVSSNRYPVVNIDGLYCRNLTINANASVTIPANRNFEIKGDMTIRNLATFTNNGTLVLRGNLLNQNGN